MAGCVENLVPRLDKCHEAIVTTSYIHAMNIWDIEQPISLPQAQMGYRIRRAVVGASVTPKAP